MKALVLLLGLTSATLLSGKSGEREEGRDTVVATIGVIVGYHPLTLQK